MPKFRRWRKDSESAIEELHSRAQVESTDILNKVLTDTLLTCKSYFHLMKSGDIHAADQLDGHLRGIFHDGTQSLTMIVLKMRRTAYTFSRGAESEIIAQILKNKPVKATVTKYDLHRRQMKKAAAGGELFPRLKMYMDRLRRKIVNFAQMSAHGSTDVDDFLKSVIRSFPKRRVVRRPKRLLKPKLMEADDNDIGGATVSLDFIDDDAWQEMLDDYMSDYVPMWRAPEYVVDANITDPTVQADGEEVWYAWEFERDLVNEFVQSVRDGQVDAATENGITDFVWIAVVDSATDACCLWRDGLLVSEIESQLDDHQGEDDECDVEDDGLNPPLHFNCRCALAPATDNIPDKPDDGKAEFDDWLAS